MPATRVRPCVFVNQQSPLLPSRLRTSSLPWQVRRERSGSRLPHVEAGRLMVAAPALLADERGQDTIAHPDSLRSFRVGPDAPPVAGCAVGALGVPSGFGRGLRASAFCWTAHVFQTPVVRKNPTYGVSRVPLFGAFPLLPRPRPR